MAAVAAAVPVRALTTPPLTVAYAAPELVVAHGPKMPLTLPSVPSVPEKLVKSILVPVVVNVPPIVKVLPETTFQACLPFKVRALLNVTFWFAVLMLMPAALENREVSSVSVFPLAMVSGPCMVPSN